jgi:hypothetical protein
MIDRFSHLLCFQYVLELLVAWRSDQIHTSVGYIQHRPDLRTWNVLLLDVARDVNGSPICFLKGSILCRRLLVYSML